MKDILKQFSLPSYLKGDSFAKDSKRISDKIRGKNKEYSSPEDIATEKELLGRLEAAQEHTKRMIEPRQENPQPPMPQQQNFLGGLMGAAGGAGAGAGGIMDMFTKQFGQQGAGQLAQSATQSATPGATPSPAGGLSAGVMGGASAGAEAVSGLLGNLADEGGGYQKEGLAAASGALSGAAKGAQMGMMAGPIGAAIGGGVGLIGGGIKSLIGAKRGNEEADKRHSANTYLGSAQTSNFALGGETGPCGGEGQPPCPELGQEDLIKINTEQNAPLQFVQDESGLEAMNTLFQAPPPPVEKASVDYGRYGDVNYFAQDEADPTGLTLKAGAGQIHNEDAIKRQFKTIQGLNPGMKLKYNAMGGDIGKEVATSGKNIQNRLQNGGPTDPKDPNNIQSRNYNNKQLYQGYEDMGPLGRAGVALQRSYNSYFPYEEGAPRTQESGKRTVQNTPEEQYNPYAWMDNLPQRSTREDEPKQEPMSPTIDGSLPDKAYDGTPYEARDKATAIDVQRLPGDMTKKGMQLEDLIQQNRIGIDRDIQSAVNTAGGAGATNLGAQGEARKELGLGNIGAQAMRAAPALANLYNLATLKKPEAESYARLNKKYKQTKVDEQELQNQVREQMAGTREAILASSGGSGSAARASLLGSQLKGSQALSSAYMQAQQANAAEAARAQQFDLGVAQTNLRQSNMETLADAQNRGAYAGQKANLISALGENVGGMGTEALFRKYPELMGMDYDTMGKYLGAEKAKLKKKKKK